MIELSAPVALVWEITNQCNLKCPHCRAYMENPERNTEVEKAVLDNIIENRILSVNLSGGEPLIHPNISRIVKMLSEQRIDVGISTNGWFYKDYAEQLYEAGLSFVQISIDGPRDVHDSFRGRQGAYDRAVQSIKTAIAMGHYVQMNVTLTAYNLSYVRDNIQLAESLGVNRVFFRRVVSAGLSKTNLDVVPNKQKYFEALKVILNYKPVTDLLISVDDPIIRVLRPTDAHEETLSCSAGITSLGIDSKGNIYPCIFLRESIGNILTDDIGEVWKSSEVLKKLRNREIEICGSCRYKYACGGCRAFSGLYSKDAFCPLD